MLRYSRFVIVLPWTRDSVLLWETTMEAFLFKHVPVLRWSRILVIHSSFKSVTERHLSVRTTVGFGDSGVRKTDRGPVLRELLLQWRSIDSKQTNKGFQLMRRAQEKIKRREMQYDAIIGGYFPHPRPNVCNHIYWSIYFVPGIRLGARDKNLNKTYRSYFCWVPSLDEG